MPTPQLPGFGDIGAFIRWKKSIDYRLNLLFEKLNNVLANTGLSVPSAGVTQVDGTLNVLGTENVSGNLNVTGNETISGNLNVTGSATIGGPTTISGATTVSGTNGIQSSNYVSGTSGWKFNGTSLEANTGVIGNGALANPISPVTLHADANNFPVTVAGNTIMSVSATVPSGYTQALFIGIYMSVAAQNTTAATDFLFPNVHMTPSLPGWQISSPSCPAGAWTAAFQQGTKLISGLTAGQVLTVSGQVSSAFANWSAVGQNEANLDVSILWLR